MALMGLWASGRCPVLKCAGLVESRTPDAAKQIQSFVTSWATSSTRDL